MLPCHHYICLADDATTNVAAVSEGACNLQEVINFIIKMNRHDTEQY